MAGDEVAVPFTSRGDEVGDELEKENARGGWVKYGWICLDNTYDVLT